MIDARIARRLLVLLAVSGLGLLAACDRSGEAGAAATVAAKVRKSAPAGSTSADAALLDANRRMAAGVPVDSSTAPVDVRFDLATVPAAGQPFEVDVGVLPAAPTPLLHVDVRSSEGLSIDAPDGPVSIEKVQAGTVQRITVKLTSATPGTRVLNVKVTLDLPTGAESRDFAYPVIVAAAAKRS
jgi:hypothetical protein